MTEDRDLYEHALELEKLGKEREAYNLYDEFIKTTTKSISPESTETAEVTKLKEKLALAYNNRGYIKYRRVDFDGAVDDYTTSLTFVHDLAIAYYNRGMIHYRLSRFEEAISDMKSCLSIDPEFEDAKTGLLMSERDKSEKCNRQW